MDLIFNLGLVAFATAMTVLLQEMAERVMPARHHSSCCEKIARGFLVIILSVAIIAIALIGLSGLYALLLMLMKLLP